MIENSNKVVVKKSRNKKIINRSEQDNNITAVDPQIDKTIHEQFYIFNYKSGQEVADEIFSSIARNLLDGALLFAYKGVDQTSDLGTLVVVQFNNPNCNKFGVYEMRKSYSFVVPAAPVEYLEEILEDLVLSKVDKKVIAAFENIKEDAENRIKANNNQ